MTAPLSLFEPVDETSSWTTSFQGRSEANCFRSQFVKRSPVDHPPLVAAADQQDGPLGREVLGEIGMIEQVSDQLLPFVLSHGSAGRLGTPGRWEFVPEGRDTLAARTLHRKPVLAGLTPAFFHASSINWSIKAGLALVSSPGEPLAGSSAAAETSSHSHDQRRQKAKTRRAALAGEQLALVHRFSMDEPLESGFVIGRRRDSPGREGHIKSRVHCHQPLGRYMMRQIVSEIFNACTKQCFQPTRVRFNSLNVTPKSSAREITTPRLRKLQTRRHQNFWVDELMRD